MSYLTSPTPADNPTEAIKVAQEYLKNNPQYSHMLEGSEISASSHNTAVDSHVVNLLDGVNTEDIHHNDYTVVTAQKDIPIEGPGNLTIPKIVKVQVANKDGEILSVLESK